jgi:hypothetical protein
VVFIAPHAASQPAVVVSAIMFMIGEKSARSDNAPKTRMWISAASAAIIHAQNFKDS